MNNSNPLLTVNHKLNLAKGFVDSVDDNQYYLFASNHNGANTYGRPYNNEEDTLISSYQGMIFGKRIHSNDASLMVRRINWQSGVQYDIYDHTDTDLYGKDFYVVINEGTQWNVFKCLENNNGGVSTVAPSLANVSAEGDDFFYPIDGYRWKYMYGIASAYFNKFATNDYIPVFTDSTVRSQAEAGALNVIKITSPGAGYGNYLHSTFGVSDIRLNGDPKKYAISAVGAKTSNGYYDGCWLYISAGGGSGQYRLIDTYASNATHNFITLVQEFDSSDLPQNGSVFEITPSVRISGDGRETLPANARAIIDPASNTVQRIEMIDVGQTYFHAQAEVMASASVGVTSQATLVPIISPYNGHGYFPPAELGSTFAGVSVQLVGSESNTIISTNDYSQIGIIKNPEFRSVSMTLSNQNRDFYSDEWLYKIKTAQLNGVVTTSRDANSNFTPYLVVTGVDGGDIVSVGDSIVITDNNTNYQLASVVSVTDTVITMSANATWDTGINSANIYLATPSSTGFISAFSTGAVTVTNALGEFATGDIIIGVQSGTHATVNAVSISGTAKNFNTFLQAYTYIGSMVQGSFQPDETLYQVDGGNTAASFHSTAPDPATSTLKIYCTDQLGIFNTSGDGTGGTYQIEGQSSGSIAALTNKFLPDLVYGSGEIIYIEYGDAITRSVEKTESFKLVFSF